VLVSDSRAQPAVTPSARKREVGRGERVLPGLWRLRLPLPFPGVPHCNAWAIAAGSGIVLVDCGMHEPGSIAQLETAMAQVGLRIEHVRRLVITHAHPDHWGQSATVIERSGCDFWMHPNHAHATTRSTDPDAAIARLVEIARQSGVPPAALERLSEEVRERPVGVAAVVEPDHPLLDGVVIETDLGPWTVYETPGHAPSHVCFYQPERRLLISGDHLLGRVSLIFEYGWTPDPIAEYLDSLAVIEPLGARLCMSGHGRTFTDIGAHITGSRELLAERLEATIEAVSVASEAVTALEIVPDVFGEALGPRTRLRLADVLCFLEHLERRGRVRRLTGDDGVERWAIA
jgi:glyoxylase-like metal-dependent hydrolase (beta-lactamase superfamily II)